MVRDIVASVLQMNGLHRLTGGLGDLVINICTFDLGDNVAVLNLNRDKLYFWAVDAMLGGDLATSMLDLRLDRVRNSMGNRSSSRRRMSNNRSNNRSSNMSISSRGSWNWSRDIRACNMSSWDGLVSKGTASNDCWISIGFSFSFTLRNVVKAIS